MPRSLLLSEMLNVKLHGRLGEITVCSIELRHVKKFFRVPVKSSSISATISSRKNYMQFLVADVIMRYTHRATGIEVQMQNTG